MNAVVDALPRSKTRQANETICSEANEEALLAQMRRTTHRGYFESTSQFIRTIFKLFRLLFARKQTDNLVANSKELVIELQRAVQYFEMRVLGRQEQDKIKILSTL